jgi:hypothetical protein
MLFNLSVEAMSNETLDSLLSLHDSTLINANLATANLSNVRLWNSELIGANLTAVNLSRTNLSRTNLTRADLTRADLTRADLTDSNLTGADLTNARLWGALGNGLEVITITLSPYRLVLCIPTRMVCVGCRSETPEYWLNLNENQAKELDADVLEFFKENKFIEFYKKEWDFVKSIIEIKFHL